LSLECIAVLPIGGAQALGRFIRELPHDRLLVGLCDAGEEAVFRRFLDTFFVCVEDLEDELIRALGPEAVEAVLEANGDLGSFRTFQKQPAWRGRELSSQLRRFLGSADRRKVRYARLLVEALDLDRVPLPLEGVLARVAMETSH